MKKSFLSVCCTLLAVVSGQAVACSCTKVEISDVIEESKDIVVARVVDAVQSSAAGDVSGRYVVEQASFEVIETIKGSKRVGQKIQTRSEIGPGPCGISARNEPMWLEQAQSPPSDAPKAFPVSDTWLIFGRDEEPYELSLCSRSSPLNVRGAEDLELVRNLLKQRARQDEP